MNEHTYCTHCGAKQDATAKFCSSCGSAIQNHTTEETHASTSADQTTISPRLQVATILFKQNKKWVLAALAVIVLIGGYFAVQTGLHYLDTQRRLDPPLATDEDFEGSLNGEFVYIGDNLHVEIPHTIKGVDVTSYQGMFERSSVQTVESTNPNVTDMSNMFTGALADHLDLSLLNTSGVENMEYMFESIQSETINFSGFDTSNVRNMQGMFSHARTPDLNLSYFDTSNVEDMSEMFEYNQATTLQLSNFNTENTREMNAMFHSSYATSIDVSSFDTSKVSNMNYMFARSAVQTLDLRNFNLDYIGSLSAQDPNYRSTLLQEEGVTNIFEEAKATEVLVGEEYVRKAFEIHGGAPEHLTITITDE